LLRISTAENFEGFYFAISWPGLTKVDKSGQWLTEEREGKDQGSDEPPLPPARPWSLATEGTQVIGLPLATEGTQERPEQNFSVHHFNRI